MTEESRTKISVSFKSADGETNIEFDGDARQFPSVIAHIGGVAGSIRPVGNLPQLPPPQHMLPPAPTPMMLPMSAHLEPREPISLPMGAPTAIQDTPAKLPKIRVKPKLQFFTSTISLGIILGVLTIFVRSPIAQKNLSKLWLDATKPQPVQVQPKPTKK